MDKKSNEACRQLKRSVAKLFGVLFVLWIIPGEQSHAQLDSMSIPENVVIQRLIDERTSDYSYLSITGGVGKVDTLWFEGKMVPWLYIYSGTYPFDVMFAPQIVLRMYRTYSSPVTSPSFMPRLRINYFIRPERLLISAIVSHHSNGQADSFYNVGGSLNVTTGNFTTNFFKFSIYSYRLQQMTGGRDGEFGSGFVLGLKWIEWIKWLEVEIPMFPGHPIDREKSLEGLYSFYRVGSAIQTSLWNLNKVSFLHIRDILNTVEFRSEIEWRSPRGLIIKPPFKDQFNVNETFLVGINERADLKVYFNYYYGEDYYNMRFERRISALRFGFQFNLGNYKIPHDTALRTE